MDQPTLTRRTDLVLINKKKRTSQLVDFAIPVGQCVKIKESKKINFWILPRN